VFTFRILSPAGRVPQGEPGLAADSRSDDVQTGRDGHPGHLVLVERNRGKEPHGDLGSREPR